MLKALAEPRRGHDESDFVQAGPERAVGNQVRERRGGQGMRAFEAHLAVWAHRSEPVRRPDGHRSRPLA